MFEVELLQFGHHLTQIVGKRQPLAAYRFGGLENTLLQPGETGLIHWEFPRLCRGGSRSLTFPGVCPAFLATAL
jgi:hypothetical protein